jgi:hypothetical protein
MIDFLQLVLALVFTIVAVFAVVGVYVVFRLLLPIVMFAGIMWVTLGYLK